MVKGRMAHNNVNTLRGRRGGLETPVRGSIRRWEENMSLGLMTTHSSGRHARRADCRWESPSSVARCLSSALRSPALWLLIAALAICHAQPGLASSQRGSIRGQPGPIISWGSSFGRQYEPASGNGYVAVCAGGYHSLALAADGRLVAWGENANGQCNVPQGNDFVAIAAGLYHNLALKSDGSLAAWGDNGKRQCKIPAGSGFLAIAAGSWHSLTIRSDGSLAAWGWNDHGQCDVPPGNDYRSISAGYYHSLALKADRSLVAWGSNGDGECNVPPGHDFVAIAAGAMHSLALRSDGTLAAWGRSSEGQCRVPPGNDFAAVAAGCLHSLALRRDGSIVTWGPDSYTQQQAPPEGRFAMIAAGSFHNLAIRGNVVMPVAVNLQGTTAGKQEDTRLVPVNIPASNEPQRVDTHPPLDTGTKSLKAEPVRSPDTRPSTAPEPNTLVSRPDSSRKGETAAQTTVVPTPPVPEPSGTAKRPDVPDPNKAAAAPAVPAKVPAITEPNATPSRSGAPGERKTAPAQAPPTKKAIPKPNVPPGRVDASKKSEPAGARAPQTKAPPAEPNIPLNLTDFFRESIAADSAIGTDPNAVPVYHFVSKAPVRHFCTVDEKEKYQWIDKHADTWKYAGIAFFAYPEGKQPRGARAVHRFWSESLGRYFFTLNESEKAMLIRDFAHIWKYEGVAWYIPAPKPRPPK